jgi:hypothetical protein
MSITETILATVGAGVLLAGLTNTGLLLRNGSTAAYIDTLDTAANFDLAYPQLNVGEAVDFYYANNVAFAATIAVGAGITAKSAAGNLVVPASSTKLIHLRKTGVATYDLFVL